jgi:broad specificity phosphatase PhoE
MRRLITLLILCIAVAGAASAAELKQIQNREQFSQLYPEIGDYLKKEGTRPVVRLFVMRHGESEGNQQKIAAGQTIPVFLTRQGEAQAEQAGRYLAKYVSTLNTTISCSPSFRAIQTSLSVAKVWNKLHPPLLEVNTYPALLERSYGRLEGMPLQQLAIFVQQGGSEWKSLSYEEKLQYRVVPEMESVQDTYERASSFLTELARKTLDDKGAQNLLITTHGQVLKALFFKLTADQQGYEVDDFSMPNCSILLFEWDGKSLLLKAIHGPEYSTKPYLSWG